jgi:hypothetical protein
LQFCYQSFTDFDQKEVYFYNLTFTSDTFKKGDKKKKGPLLCPLKGVLVLIADEIIYASSKSTVI